MFKRMPPVIHYLYSNKAAMPVKKIFTVLVLAVLCTAMPLHAGQNIVAVQSSRLAPYERALSGFKNIRHENIARIILSELSGTDVVGRIRELNPSLIIAVGNEALSAVRPISDIPVIYLMVHNPQNILSGERNITGVSMTLAPEQQLATLCEALPEVKRIGLLYNPAISGAFVAGLSAAAARIGRRITAREIHDSRQVPEALQSLKGEIDAFWMLPDQTLITKVTVEHLFLFCIGNRIPVVTFSEKYVESGALLSISIDPFDIGRQAAEIAGNLLSRTDSDTMQQSAPRAEIVAINTELAQKIMVTINRQVANNLGIALIEMVNANVRTIN